MPAELDEVERRVMQLEIEREALRKESDAASQGAARPARTRAGGPEGDAHAAGRPVAAARRTPFRASASRRKSSSSCAARSNARSARATTRRRPSCSTGAFRSSSAQIREHEQRPRRTATGARGCSRKQVDEEDIAEVVVAVDAHSRQPADGRRGAEARPHGRAAAPARRRPGRRGRRRGQCDSPRARRPAGSEPAARQLHLSRPDRRRQDRARARAGRVPVRRRAGDGAHRHVRVPGEAHRLAADRRAARIRRLRGGRPADRSRPPPAVRRRALRRNREGASRSAERACCSCSTTAG